jgi:sugar phosphate isomerase/epimerase
MNLQLGVVTDEISDDLQEALDTATEWGIQQVELHNVWGKNICHLTDADLSRALRLVRRSGLPVTCIDSLTLRCRLDDDAEYEQHVRHLLRSIEIAPLFGTNVVRLFSFWKEPALDAEGWERVFAKMELPIRIAEREGVTLGFENVASGNIGTSGDCERLFAEFDSPALRLIWDPANARAAGDGRSAAEGYSRLRAHIHHVHVKDVAFADGQREWRPIGGGEVDYAGFFRALLADGYGGVVALETHYRAPGRSALESSRESLDGLLAALAAATEP